jgi:hypothetical protein
MELDSVDERVFIDRTGVCGAAAERLAVWLAGPSNVLGADLRERDKLDRIDLDLAEAHGIAPADFDLRTLP